MIWPLVDYFVFVVFLVATTLVVSYLLGQRHFESATGEPYEGGIVSEGSARVRLSVHYRCRCKSSPSEATETVELTP